MSYKLLFEVTRIGNDLFGISIYSGTAPFTEYNAVLEEFGKLSIGNDDEANEMILYPGNFDIKFNLESFDKFIEVLPLLRGSETYIEITKNGTLHFKSILDTDTIDGEPSEWELGISCSFFDDYNKLNDGYDLPAAGYNKRFLDFINDYLGFAYDEMIVNSYFRFTYIDALSNPQYAYIHQVGCNENLRFKSRVKTSERDFTHYSTKADVLKVILNSFAAFGVIGLDRKFYFVPRFYDGQTIKRLDNTNVYEDSLKMSFAKSFRGLRVFAHITDIYYVEKHWGDVEYVDGELKYPDEIETIFIPCPVDITIDENATYPGKSSLKYIAPDDAQFLINCDSTQHKNTLGAYGTTKSLVNWVGSLIWNTIQNIRKKLIITAVGTNYLFSDFFQYFSDDSIYRPIKLIYNNVEEETELVLIECASVDEFVPGIAIEGIPVSAPISETDEINIYTGTAGQDLSALRAVVVDDDGGIVYADNSNPDHKNKVLGITITSALDADEVQVRTSGIIEDDSWAWTLNVPILLDTNGALTQAVPASGFVLIVGYPLSETSMFVDIKQPIVIN